MLSKKLVFFTCQGAYVNLICGLYEISYKPIYKKFMSSLFCVKNAITIVPDVRMDENWSCALHVTNLTKIYQK
jgi:hypothetical protein